DGQLTSSQAIAGREEVSSQAAPAPEVDMLLPPDWVARTGTPALAADEGARGGFGILTTKTPTLTLRRNTGRGDNAEAAKLSRAPNRLVLNWQRWAWPVAAMIWLAGATA